MAIDKEQTKTIVAAGLGVKTPILMPKANQGVRGAKILLFGPVGSGKTHGLVDLIEAGEKLLVVSTEQGGNGLISVRNELKRRGHADLFASNVFAVDPENYSQVLECFAKVKGGDGKVYPKLYDHYPELRSFGVTTLVWEGLSNFQQTHLSNHLLGDALAVDDAYADPRKYWGELGRAMRLIHHDFIHLNDPDRAWNHILTVHDYAEWPKDEKGNRAKGATKPLAITFAIQGSYNPAEAYDLVIRTRKDEKPNMSNPMGAPIVTHTYQFNAGSDKATVKNRGYGFPDEMPANMVEVWQQVKQVMQDDPNIILRDWISKKQEIEEEK